MHTLEQLRSGKLAGIERLQLACGLTEFPREIFSLAETLEILDLSGNALSALPDDLPRLAKLRIIFCSDNRFTELPEVLGACPALTMVGFKANRIRRVSGKALPAQLRWLVLTGNDIETLPAELGQRPLLQKLMLAGNRLTALPAELAQCRRLELLRIAANRLTELPAWLPGLPRLAWLAYAGNPFCPAQQALPEDGATAGIAWSVLELGSKLGEGASGVIYRAAWRDGAGAALPASAPAGSAPGMQMDAAADPDAAWPAETKAVAVKLFKGAMTSDGSPLCEMAACIAADAHPNLIPILGRVSGHPAGAHGLVMDLIDPGFVNLAGPPSLDSCTRDIYPADKRFRVEEMLAIAHGIASAASQLHRRGIMHGDLYGHNILHNAQGNTLLGDFGAASFHDADTGDGLQRLEVRAFGCLLEELLERCDDERRTASPHPGAAIPGERADAALRQGADAAQRPLSPQAAGKFPSVQAMLKHLAALKNACLLQDTGARPLFAEIARELAALRETTLDNSI